jgi:hypothetical protein
MGKPSISVGHLYHGYVTNNQRVYGLTQQRVVCFLQCHPRIWRRQKPTASWPGPCSRLWRYLKMGEIRYQLVYPKQCELAHKLVFEINFYDYVSTAKAVKSWIVKFRMKIGAPKCQGTISFFCIQLVDCSQTLGYKSWTKTYTYSHLMSFIVIFTHQPSCFQGFNHFAPNTFRKPPGKSGSFVMT